ncbi:MAG: iron ABC transporter ATP-binding protein [Actinobacteria bacterium HGW-Actinobacteria-5]|nr:MAG: iron ABC transporter ATP-binding protein [Actinobacteria bacterium HGW-Actinobacteria-5]
MRPLLRILGVARELLASYAAIVASGVLVAATGLAVPFIIKAATDEVVASMSGTGVGVPAVLWLAFLLLLVDLANTLITNVGGYLGDVMAVRLRSILSRNYFEKLLRLPQRYFDSELTGTIISRLQRSITETTGFLNMFANNFLPMLLSLAAALVIIGWYSWWLALLLLAVYPLFTWLTAITSKRWQRLEREKNAEFDIAGGRFAEVAGQIRVVKSFVAERRELDHFAGRYDTTIALTKEQSAFWHRMDVARRGTLNLIFFGIYAIIFSLTITGDFTLGVMVLLIQLVSMARQPVQSMSFLVDASQRAITGSRDYFQVMDAAVESAAVEADAPRPVEPSTAPGEPIVEFCDARFGYGDEVEVLKGVSFDVRRGERVAFVGESGVGKTTLSSLLLGLYPLTGGRLVVDGRDVGSIPLPELRAQVGVVFQDPSLFSGTIRENIAYGRPDASEDEIVEAARRAHAHGFIIGLPGGYDAEIGERGVKLSGGQKQRIAVARALLKDAPILVLDEATSSLDSKAERLVQEGLDELMAERTTLIIAHRLSTISSVDRIITLADGRIDEIGTPDELARTGGIYAELLELQHAGTKAGRRRLQRYEILG